MTFPCDSWASSWKCRSERGWVVLQTSAVKGEAHAGEPQGAKAVHGEGPDRTAATLTVLAGLERNPMGPEMTGLWDPSEEDTNGSARRNHKGRRARGEPHFCSSAPRSRQMGGKEAKGQHRQSRPHNPHNGPASRWQALGLDVHSQVFVTRGPGPGSEECSHPRPRKTLLPGPVCSSAVSPSQPMKLGCQTCCTMCSSTQNSQAQLLPISCTRTAVRDPHHLSRGPCPPPEGCAGTGTAQTHS